MATKKVTITLPEEQVEQIRTLVAAGRAPSVSGFVQHAVAVAIDDAVGWGVAIAAALDETGGPLTAEEQSWAEEVLGLRGRRGRTLA